MLVSKMCLVLVATQCVTGMKRPMRRRLPGAEIPPVQTRTRSDCAPNVTPLSESDGYETSVSPSVESIGRIRSRNIYPAPTPTEEENSSDDPAHPFNGLRTSLNVLRRMTNVTGPQTTQLSRTATEVIQNYVTVVTQITSSAGFSDNVSAIERCDTVFKKMKTKIMKNPDEARDLLETFCAATDITIEDVVHLSRSLTEEQLEIQLECCQLACKEGEQSHAFAQGWALHLAAGIEKHLPHELGHVVQQNQGRLRRVISKEELFRTVFNLRIGIMSC